ncbi:MAG: biotin--[acetyl-CoA-carboxylase] ligase [Ekhidna sp.]|uniref:biotin--[acetyl-CoA-carboxylase] ligase n=1 Tax=Ekhidna sp. TaxID=2608089 RepID=UPI0032ED0603
MHKIFAKPLFLGKKVVFLPQCHSTNDELVSLAKKSVEPEGLVLYTDDQTKGRGQRGNVWLAEPGKNILMSLLLRPKWLAPNDQYYLNLIVGLAMLDMLKSHVNGELVLKWPNDVYLSEKKIAGILIENSMRGSVLESSVVGIGLNVNQKGFNLSSATSIYLETGKEQDRVEMMEQLLIYLEQWYLKLKSGSQVYILNEYHKSMMWRGELRTFKVNEEEFEGEILGIDSNGRLTINERDKLRNFGIKEVKFVR